jgi:ribosomal protein S12 methylthiotransferase accessory factor
MPKDPTEPAAPYVFRAQLANHRFVKEKGDELIASGKGMTKDEAMASALGEAVERYSASCWDDRKVTFARRTDLPGKSVDPRDLVLYRPEQYADLPYAPYRVKTRLGWVQATSVTGGGLVWVPALAVSMAYQVRSSDEFLFGPTSNGLASGPTPSAALLSATLEVLERDAFVIAWSNRLPCTRIDPRAHPDEDIRWCCASYQRRGVTVHLARLPVDHPVHVILAFAVDSARHAPAVVVGLGADLSPARAARKAVLEIGQVRPALRMRLRDPQARNRMAELVEDPHRVATLDDHDLLYAAPGMVHAFDFLLAGSLGDIEWDRDAGGATLAGAVTDELARIADRLRSAGADLLAYDLSAPELVPLGLHTMRAIVPGFQPIDFGWKERRLGGTRLFEFPCRAGLAPRPNTVTGLNDLPHPLA